MNLKCVTAGGVVLGLGAAVIRKTVSRITGSQSVELGSDNPDEASESDSTDARVIDYSNVDDIEQEKVTDRATVEVEIEDTKSPVTEDCVEGRVSEEEVEEEVEEEAEDDVFVCEEQGCEKEFDSEHGRSVHAGIVH